VVLIFFLLFGFFGWWCFIYFESFCGSCVVCGGGIAPPPTLSFGSGVSPFPTLYLILFFLSPITLLFPLVTHSCVVYFPLLVFLELLFFAWICNIDILLSPPFRFLEDEHVSHFSPFLFILFFLFVLLVVSLIQF